MPKPRRCYQYTSEAQLLADIDAGIISEQNAATLREFGEQLRKMGRKRPPVDPEITKP